MTNPTDGSLVRRPDEAGATFRVRSLLVVLLLTLSLAACGGPDSEPASQIVLQVAPASTLAGKPSGQSPVHPGADAGPGSTVSPPIVQAPDAGSRPVAPDAGSTTTAPVPDAGSSAQQGMPVPDFVTLQGQADSFQSVVDANGVTHAAYSAGSSVYYARCASNCGKGASWTRASIPNAVSGAWYAFIGGITLAPGGKLVILFSNVTLSLSEAVGVAQCTSNCTTSAGWTTVAPFSGAIRTRGNPLAVDGAGRIWIVFDTGYHFRLGTCASNCGVDSSWSVGADFIDVDEFDLRLTSTGGLRAMVQRKSPRDVDYWSCDSNCLTANSWTATGLYGIAAYNSNVKLRLDSSNRPRVMFRYTDPTGNYPQLDDKLFFGWCDANCGVAGSWSFVFLGENKDGLGGLDFALTATGGVVAVVRRNTASFSGIAMMICTAACATVNSTWSERGLESWASLTAAVPPVGPPGYKSAAWEINFPRLTLNHVRNVIQVSWDADLEFVGADGKPGDYYMARIAEL